MLQLSSPPYFLERASTMSFSIEDGPVATGEGDVEKKSASSLSALASYDVGRSIRTRRVALDLGGVAVDEELLKVPLDAGETEDAGRAVLQEAEDLVGVVAVDIALLCKWERHAVVDLRGEGGVGVSGVTTAINVPEPHLAKQLDLLFGSRFLAAELVLRAPRGERSQCANSNLRRRSGRKESKRETHARKAEDDEALVVVLLVELLEAAVLACEATIRRGIDHQNRLVCTERASARSENNREGAVSQRRAA